jgi:Peptidase_C39 like family
MKSISHKVKHQYQPTNSSCSPTALSILLSHYDMDLTVDDISKQVPQVKNEDGEDSGTINQQLATYAISLGFSVSLYTFDCQIIDMSWQDLSISEIIDRLEAAKGGWIVPSLGKQWSEAYRQSYIDYLKAGGRLIIQPAVTTQLMYKLLEDGPILPCLCSNTLYGKGKSRSEDSTSSVLDDVNGRAFNHSVVVYGVDEQGNFLIADPWYEPGLHTIEPERMVAAISTAQIECDNLILQIFDI